VRNCRVPDAMQPVGWVEAVAKPINAAGREAMGIADALPILRTASRASTSCFRSLEIKTWMAGTKPGHDEEESFRDASNERC
jgi:hypothetical protein